LILLDLLHYKKAFYVDLTLKNGQN